MGYRSPSQIARRVTEHWAEANLFCVACRSEKLEPLAINTPVRDYRCPACSARYQLKGKDGAFGGRAQNSAYSVKLQAIEAGEAPHYVFLSYSRKTWNVTDLFVVPGHFFTPALIEQRRPLKSTARRAGWVGSNILLYVLPSEARIRLISEGHIHAPSEVRAAWHNYAFLGTDERARGGWGADVLRCVRTLQAETSALEFSLQDFYRRFAGELGRFRPDNRNVEAKIRQQLQVLRDGGVLSFMGHGRYRIIRQAAYN